MNYQKIQELDNILPLAGEPLGNYLNIVKSGNILFTSGALPISEGKIQYFGKMGHDNISIETASEAAKLCIINILSNIKAEIGSITKIKKIVKLTGFVNSALDFADHPLVINGASNYLTDIFGDDIGKHARSALGVACLPKNALVEIEAIIEIEDY